MARELLPWTGGMRAIYRTKAAELGYTIKWSGGLAIYKDGIYLGTPRIKAPFCMEDAVHDAEILKQRRISQRGTTSGLSTAALIAGYLGASVPRRGIF